MQNQGAGRAKSSRAPEGQSVHTFPWLLVLPAAPGLWLPHPHLCLCPHTASLSLGVSSVSKFLSWVTGYTGFGAHSNPIRSHLIISTKTLFPNKVTLTDEGVHTSLGAHDLNHKKLGTRGVCFLGLLWQRTLTRPRKQQKSTLPVPEAGGMKPKCWRGCGGNPLHPLPSLGGLRAPQLGDSGILLCSCLPLGCNSPFYKDTSDWIRAHPNDL